MGNLFARLLGDGLSEAEKAAPFPVQELMTLSVFLNQLQIVNGTFQTGFSRPLHHLLLPDSVGNL